MNRRRFCPRYVGPQPVPWHAAGACLENFQGYDETDPDYRMTLHRRAK